jgi:site-specific recombinase XerD
MTALPTLIDLYAATKETEGKAKKTVSWYRWMLGKFAAFVGDAATIKDVNLQNARAFIASQQSRTSRYDDHPVIGKMEGKLSTYTIHGYVRALKAFSAWLYDESFTATNVLAKLKRPELKEQVVEILSDEEIQRLLDAANPNCFLGSRLYTMVLLFLDTGIRATELLTLRVEDTDLAHDKIKVTGKGDKERIVPIGPTTKKALLRYLSGWRPQSDEPYVFLGVTGEPLTYNGLSHIISRLGQRAGIPRLHCHLFRHSFATKYLINGGDLVSLKMMLGHTDVSVTQVYVNLAAQHVQVQHHNFSPIEHLKIDKKRRKKAA